MNKNFPPIIPVLFALFAATNLFSQQASTNSTPDRFEGNVDIGGRKLHLATFGKGTPTVVVESGLGEPAVESGTWKVVIAGVAKSNCICVYDRAGLGKSDAVTNTVRTSREVAEDLHNLLKAAKIAPPYILVGHSLGGFTIRLYAKNFPDEVAGIVLEDSSYPGQGEKWLSALPPESATESESVKKMRSVLVQMATEPTKNPERFDLTTSGVQAAAAGNFGDKPLVVISRNPQWRMDETLPNIVSDKMEQLWQDWQKELCGLSTQSSHQVAVKAGHYIHPDEPQLVIDAIFKVISETKK